MVKNMFKNIVKWSLPLILALGSATNATGQVYGLSNYEDDPSRLEEKSYAGSSFGFGASYSFSNETSYLGFEPASGPVSNIGVSGKFIDQYGGVFNISFNSDLDHGRSGGKGDLNRLCILNTGFKYAKPLPNNWGISGEFNSTNYFSRGELDESWTGVDIGLSRNEWFKNAEEFGLATGISYFFKSNIKKDSRQWPDALQGFNTKANFYWAPSSVEGLSFNLDLEGAYRSRKLLRGKDYEKQGNITLGGEINSNYEILGDKMPGELKLTGGIGLYETFENEKLRGAFDGSSPNNGFNGYLGIELSSYSGSR